MHSGRNLQRSLDTPPPKGVSGFGVQNRKFYCLRQGTSKRGEVREGSLTGEETHARVGTLWHEGLACMVTK